VADGRAVAGERIEKIRSDFGRRLPQTLRERAPSKNKGSERVGALHFQAIALSSDKGIGTHLASALDQVFMGSRSFLAFMESSITSLHVQRGGEI
jgi:hypothetical protein